MNFGGQRYSTDYNNIGIVQVNMSGYLVSVS